LRAQQLLQHDPKCVEVACWWKGTREISILGSTTFGPEVDMRPPHSDGQTDRISDKKRTHQPAKHQLATNQPASRETYHALELLFHMHRLHVSL